MTCTRTESKTTPLFSVTFFFFVPPGYPPTPTDIGLTFVLRQVSRGVPEGLASLTAPSSNDSDRLQGPNQILYRLKSFFFFFLHNLHCCLTMFLQEKKKHSITIFKSNVIHHGYTVVAVLRGNHLTKEHGSKVGGLHFTEGKENSTNKTIQNYTSHD